MVLNSLLVCNFRQNFFIVKFWIDVKYYQELVFFKTKCLHMIALRYEEQEIVPENDSKCDVT